MDCPKRPYKILGLFKSFRPHDWQVVKVGVFMKWISNDYTVEYKCSFCELTHKRSFVEAEELMRKGYTAEQLAEFKGIEI